MLYRHMQYMNLIACWRAFDPFWRKETQRELEYRHWTGMASYFAAPEENDTIDLTADPPTAIRHSP